MNNTEQIVSHLGQFTIYFSSIYLLQGLYIQNCSRGVHSTVWTNEPTETEQKINFQSVLQKFGSDFSRALGGTLGKIRFGTDENRQPTNLIEVFKKKINQTQTLILTPTADLFSPQPIVSNPSPLTISVALPHRLSSSSSAASQPYPIF